MSVATQQLEQQPNDAEELVRSLGEIPTISPELRTRVLVAASQAASETKRQRGWAIVAGFASTCAAIVLAVACFGPGDGDDFANDSRTYDPNSALPATAEETINDALKSPSKPLSSSVLPQP